MMTLPPVMKSACVSAVYLAVMVGGAALAGAGTARADQDDVCRALHEAAFLDEPEDVRDLIQHGADVNCLDVLGQTPLVTAVNGASIESFDILLKAGANVHVRTELGQTLLTHTKKKYATFRGEAAKRLRQLYGDMVARLQRAGARN